MKYDTMIEKNQQESIRKIKYAKIAIDGLVDNGERINVNELVKRTGLSRGFFYKNKEVRGYMNNAIRGQEATYSPQMLIMDKALEEKKAALNIELLKLKSENTKLIEQNLRLTEQLEELEDENRVMHKKYVSLKRKLDKKEIELLKDI